MFSYFSGSKFDWLRQSDIRPYVFVREENRVQKPGTLFDSHWFPQKPVYINPLHMEEVGFADQILKLETLAFQKSGMAMDRWVFYDCAVMPGFVAGFAHKRSSLPQALQEALAPDLQQEWVPLSLFIVIPTMAHQSEEWVAHNLCSANSLLPKENRFYGLGFLTKAFALWYANIGNCCGVTQWSSPATSLHSHYGEFELLTAYTPVHSYPKTLTYRLNVNPDYWEAFFTKNHEKVQFDDQFEATSLTFEPQNEESLKKLQLTLQKRTESYYLNPKQMRELKSERELLLYRKKN